SGGDVAGAFITPYLNDNHGGARRATQGKVYLSANLDWNMRSGGTESPVNDFTSLTERFAKNPVFEIPADTEKATVVRHAKVSVGPTGDDQDNGKGSAELTIT